MNIHPLVYDICRAALAQVLLTEAADRTYDALNDYPDPTVAPDTAVAAYYVALIEDGVIDTSPAQQVIDLAERFSRLDDDDEDLAALAATYSHTQSRPFPSPESEQLLRSWGTSKSPVADPREMFRRVVAAESAAAFDLDLGRLSVRYLDAEEVRP